MNPTQIPTSENVTSVLKQFGISLTVLVTAALISFLLGQGLIGKQSAPGTQFLGVIMLYITAVGTTVLFIVLRSMIGRYFFKKSDAASINQVFLELLLWAAAIVICLKVTLGISLLPSVDMIRIQGTMIRF